MIDKMILHVTENWKRLLLDCINLYYTTHVYPEEWTAWTIKLIPKSNQQEPRFIVLTSNMSKLVERLVSQRLYPWLEQQQRLPSTQSGFRKGRSTLVLAAKTDIKKRRTPAVILDVKAAFDNVIPELHDKPNNIGISKNPLTFIQALMSGRKAHFHIFDVSGNSHPITRPQHKGRGSAPPQGVFSPLLFLIYVSDIANNIPSATTAFQCADDIAIYAANYILDFTISTLETSATVLTTNLRHVAASTYRRRSNFSTVKLGEFTTHVKTGGRKSKA